LLPNDCGARRYRGASRVPSRRGRVPPSLLALGCDGVLEATPLASPVRSRMVLNLQLSTRYRQPQMVADGRVTLGTASPHRDLRGYLTETRRPAA